MSSRVIEKTTDVAVIGGGPAGMAAAWSAARCGAKTVLLERMSYLGGVLPQCVHDGFGLYSEGESMTGPGYAHIWKEKLSETDAIIALNTAVVKMQKAKLGIILSCVGPGFGGAAEITAGTVILATGCRERSRGQLKIPGTRPAGIMTAGTAQYMMNIQNQLPGDKVVILGSGDIGLIMARRLKLEGADVRMVLGQEATGLYRNHVQCIREMDIPFRTGWTITSVHGRGRLKGVMAAPIGPDGKPELGKREYIRCNTLLIAAGLIPERDIEGLDEVMRDADESLMLAGNVEHIHDLADGAAIQGVQCGVLAARRAKADGHSLDVPEDVKVAAEMIVPREQTETRTDKGLLPERCTGCPTSCMVELVMEGDEITEVRGARCERGAQILREQMQHPVRVFTGTVKMRKTGSKYLLIPVFTSAAVPVSEMMHIAKLCRGIKVSGPVSTGQVIRKNIGGTGVDLLASSGS